MDTRDVLYIGGEWVAPASTKTFTVAFPWRRFLEPATTVAWMIRLRLPTVAGAAPEWVRAKVARTAPASRLPARAVKRTRAPRAGLSVPHAPGPPLTEDNGRAPAGGVSAFTELH